MSTLDVRKKQRQVVVFLATQSFTLKNKQELFEILCVHKLNLVPGKRSIYMIPTLEFVLFMVLFVRLFISDWS